jgi:hypothetical protein
MIRLRGGALLVVGVGLLFVALSFIGAVAVHAMPHDGQGQTVRLRASVGVRLAEPIEDLRRELPSPAAECADANPTRRKTGSTTQRVLDTRIQTAGRYFYVGERADL